jgi:hypothetical protein
VPGETLACLATSRIVGGGVSETGFIATGLILAIFFLLVKCFFSSLP